MNFSRRLHLYDSYKLLFEVSVKLHVHPGLFEGHRKSMNALISYIIQNGHSS